MREIAERLDASKSTIASDLRAPAPRYAGLVPGAGSAEPGNVRALKHGLYSERTVAPIRERHALALAEQYPELDLGRIATEAQRRALIELASGWIDRRGVVRDEEGRVFDAAVKLAGWLSQSERWIERAASERRDRYDMGGLDALRRKGAEIIARREAEDAERR